MEIDRTLFILLSRINGVAQALREDVKPWLASKNNTTGPSVRFVTSFNLVERFVYHFEAVQHLLEPFARNHNMALPIAQLLRAVVYDIIVSYWLPSEGAAFDNKLKSLNGDFIKKNTAILRGFIDEAGVQATWNGWSNIAPESFNPVANDELAPATFTRVTFAEMCAQVLAVHDYQHLRNLPYIYSILSQQAHVSSFSKRFIYGKEAEHYRIFDMVAHATLTTCGFLLEPFQDARVAQTKISEWLDRLYPTA